MSGTPRSVPEEAIAYLRSTDPIIAGIIDNVGPFEYRVDEDVWRSLVGSIVGQQLSVKAAATIRGRVAALGADGFPTPDEILALPDDLLRGSGLSRAKTEYVRSVATAWASGAFAPETLHALDDEAVIERLVRLRGVGRWTAEMVLLFSLGRPDVLAVDDLGIRVAIQRAYGMPERPGRTELGSIGAPWSPYRSYASLYLWRSLEE